MNLDKTGIRVSASIYNLTNAYIGSGIEKIWKMYKMLAENDSGDISSIVVFINYEMLCRQKFLSQPVQ